MSTYRFIYHDDMMNSEFVCEVIARSPGAALIKLETAQPDLASRRLLTVLCIGLAH